MHTRIVINAEVSDTKAGNSIHKTHRAVLLTGIAEPLHVVDAARACFPMRHRSPLRLMLGQSRLNDLARHAFPMWDVDDHNVLRLRIEGVCSQFFSGRRFHANGQPVDAGKCPVDKHHNLIAWHHGREHHVQAAPTCASNAECVNVVRPHHIAQHHFAFNHTPQNVRVHVIGQASASVAC